MSLLPHNPNEGLEFDPQQLQGVVLAGGCYWGTQAFLDRVYGVAHSEVGFANGDAKRYPTVDYETVCRQNTGYAEAVRVAYDPSRLSLRQLLEAYFETIDPTSFNRQGGDVGSQYRTGIYYMNPEDEAIARAALDELAQRYDRPICVELEPLERFIPAHEAHQKYLEKNPNGYCHVDVGQVVETNARLRQG